MADDKRISELPLATTPLAGTEEQEIVQGGVNKRVAVSEVGGGSGSFVPLTLAANTTILTGGFYLRLQGTGVQVPRLVLDAPNNVRKTLAFRTGDVARWEIHMEDNETGANAGSNLHFERLDDSGVFIDAPLVIDRATGVAAFSIGPTVPTAAVGTNTTQAASTAFVRAETVGLQDLYLTGSSFVPRETSGCDSIKVEVATSLVNLLMLSFTSASDSYSQIVISLPRNWNSGTIRAKLYWQASSGSGDVVWEVKGGAYSNDDALTGALGTGVTVTDTLTAVDDLMVTSYTTAITLSGSPAAGDLVVLQVGRLGSDVADTFSANANLIGVSIELTTNAAVAS